MLEIEIELHCIAWTKYICDGTQGICGIEGAREENGVITDLDDCFKMRWCHGRSMMDVTEPLLKMIVANANREDHGCLFFNQQPSQFLFALFISTLFSS